MEAEAQVLSKADMRMEAEMQELNTAGIRTGVEALSKADMRMEAEEQELNTAGMRMEAETQELSTVGMRMEAEAQVQILGMADIRTGVEAHSPRPAGRVHMVRIFLRPK